MAIDKNRLEKIILGERHNHILYGYETKERETFLQSLEDTYPVKMNMSSPIAVYTSEIGLPVVTNPEYKLDSIELEVIAREFLNCTISKAIVDRLVESSDADLLSSRLEYYFDLLCKYNIGNKDENIKNLKDLSRVLQNAKDEYRMCYEESLRNGERVIPIYSMYIDPVDFVKAVKLSLNNNGYFGIVLDKQVEMPKESTIAINKLIGFQTSKHFTINLAVEPGKWQTYSMGDGNVIRSIHDYLKIELDDSYTKYKKYQAN